MTIERIFDIQGFDGGEADDSTKGASNTFYSGENIEVRKDLSGVQLSSKIEDTGYVFDAKIIYMINAVELGGSDIGLITCLSNGKIFLNGSLVYTFNTGTVEWDRITGIGMQIVSGTTYYYMISQPSGGVSKIHKFDSGLGYLSTLATTITGLASDIKRSYTLTNPAFLFIGIGNQIYTLDTSEVVVQSLLLPKSETIRGLTGFQDIFKIYTNKGGNGVQYYWDGTSNKTDYRQEWVNLPILAIVNDGAYDYALLGFNQQYSSLYLIAGTQKQEITKNLEDNSTARTLGGTSSIDSTQFLSNRNGLIYISGKTKESSNYGVYTYGNYYPGASKSMTQSYSGTTLPFYYHCHGALYTYMADNSATAPKVYKILHSNPPSNYADGYIISNMYKGISWEDKTLNRIKIGYNLGTGASFKVYARTSLGGSWTLIKTITDTTKKRILIAGTEIENANLGTFNEIQFKIELIAGTSDDYTPLITRFTAYFYIVNND